MSTGESYLKDGNTNSNTYSVRDIDFEDRPLQPQGHHQAHIEDITLRTAEDFGQFDLNDPFDIGPSDGIGSHDFNDVDLGIGWDEPARASEGEGNEDMSVDESVGMARDAPPRRDSVDSHLLRRDPMELDFDLLSNKVQSRAVSEHPFAPDVNMDFPDFGGMDLGDFGIGFDEIPPQERENTPGQTRSSSRACT